MIDRIDSTAALRLCGGVFGRAPEVAESFGIDVRDSGMFDPGSSAACAVLDHPGLVILRRTSKYWQDDVAEITVLHELGHVVLHIRTGQEPTFELAFYNCPQPADQERELEAWEWALQQLGRAPTLREKARIVGSLESYGLWYDNIVSRLKLV